MVATLPINHAYSNGVVDSAEALQLRDDDGECRCSVGKEVQLCQIVGRVDFYTMVGILIWERRESERERKEKRREEKRREEKEVKGRRER